MTPRLELPSLKRHFDHCLHNRLPHLLTNASLPISSVIRITAGPLTLRMVEYGDTGIQADIVREKVLDRLARDGVQVAVVGTFSGNHDTLTLPELFVLANRGAQFVLLSVARWILRDEDRLCATAHASQPQCLPMTSMTKAP